MKTFKTKQFNLVEIENPYNLIFINELMNLKLSSFCIRNNNSTKYAHGILKNSELNEEIKKGTSIFIEDKDVLKLDFAKGLLIDKTKSFLSYNNAITN